MSTATGSVSPLVLPVPPDDGAQTGEIISWITLVNITTVSWADSVVEKIKEFDTLTTNGEGLALTTYVANANVTKQDGKMILFDGDPNVGTPGVGIPGWYRWNTPTNLWIKY